MVKKGCDDADQGITVKMPSNMLQSPIPGKQITAGGGDVMGAIREG